MRGLVRIRRALSIRANELSSVWIGVLILVLGCVILVVGQVHQHGWRTTGFFNELYPNIGSSLVIAAVLILVVDRLAQQRDELRLKQQLVREMSSTDHGLAARAVAELDVRGWLYDGTLSGVSLAGSDLTGASLEGSCLTGANMAGANLERANLSRAQLAGSNLSGARLSRVNLEMADLTHSNLQDAMLRRADMAKARLVHATLAGASLRDADLTNADLTDADLRGADLMECRLADAILRRVIYDNSTKWPTQGLPGQLGQSGRPTPSQHVPPHPT